MNKISGRGHYNTDAVNPQSSAHKLYMSTNSKNDEAAAISPRISGILRNSNSNEPSPREGTLGMGGGVSLPEINSKLNHKYLSDQVWVYGAGVGAVGGTGGGNSSAATSNQTK